MRTCIQFHRTLAKVILFTFAFQLVSLLPGAVLAAQQSPARSPGSLADAGKGLGPLTDVAAQNKIALVVGVGGYNPRFANELKYTQKDARDFAQFLEERWQFQRGVNLWLMSDELGVVKDDPAMKPEYMKLRAQLKAVLERVDEKSEVVLYFSGHGISKKVDQKEAHDYLIPVDWEGSDIDRTCISLNELVDALRAKKPRRAVLFFDACRNVSPDKAVGGSGEFGHLLARDPGIAVLYSCEPGQKSFEGLGHTHEKVKAARLPRVENGVFTHFLLEGLRGRDETADPAGNITFERLYSFVRAEVEKYVLKSYAVPQQPKGVALPPQMVLDRAGRDDAAAVALVQDDKADALVREGYSLLAAGAAAPARQKAREALAVDPNNAHAHFILGRCHELASEKEAAVREYQRALELDRQLIAARTRLDELDPAPTQTAEQLVAEAEGAVAAKAYDTAQRVAVLAQRAPGGDAAAIRARIHAVLGTVALEKQEFPAATGYFEAAGGEQSELPLVKDGLRRLAKRAPGLNAATVDRLAYEAYALAQGRSFEKAETLARQVIDEARRLLEVQAMDVRLGHALGTAHYVLGLVLESRRDYQQAADHLDRARRQEPTLENVTESLARVQAELARAQQAPRAQQAREQVEAGRFAEAERLANAVLKADPNNALARYVLGRAFQNRQAVQEAIREYQTAERLDPSLRAETGPRIAECIRQIEGTPAALVARAREHLERGELSEAEKKAGQALGMQERNAAARLVLAQVYIQLRRLEEALTEANLAAHYDPQLKEAQGLQQQLRQEKARGIAQQAQGRLKQREYGAASDLARQAIALDPRSALAHAVLARALVQLDRREEALAAAKQANALDKNLPLAWAAFGCYYYKAYEDQYRAYLNGAAAVGELETLYNRAAEYLAWAVRLDAADPIAHSDLAAVYMAGAQRPLVKSTGRLAEAAILKAMELQPQADCVLFNLGILYLVKGTYEGEQPAFNARRSGDRASEGQFFQQAMGDYRRAEEQWQNMLRLYPQNHAARGYLAFAVYNQYKVTEAQRSPRSELLLRAQQEALQAWHEGLRDHAIYRQKEIRDYVFSRLASTG